mgnify:CR=1 FL=1
MENKICPKCGKTFEGVGALSRRDNKTEICSECGRKEAINDYIDFYNHILFS